MQKSFSFYLAFYYYKIILWLQKICKRENKIYPTFTNIIFKICPDYLKIIAKPNKVISIMGTNGKTTLCNLLKDSLEQLGYQVINNNEYSYNTGIAHCFTKYANLKNKCQKDYAIIETDELTCQDIFKDMTPDIIVVTNLFRDSIKLNDNPSYILEKMKEAIPKNVKLILNADDLISSSLKQDNTIFYGVSKLKNEPNKNYIVKDITLCPKCQNPLIFNYIHYNHIGQAYCPNCHFASSKPKYLLTNIDKDTCTLNQEKYPLINNTIFNIYNETALISTLKELNFKPFQIKTTLSKINITLSRLTEYNINNTKMICLLAKGQNPVATSQVLNYISNEENKMDVILMLDDLKDNQNSSETIAWFYDTDFEFLNKENIRNILVVGPRSKDLYIRLLLANIPKNKIIIMLKQEQLPNKVNLDGIDTLFFLYDIYSLSLARKLEQEILKRYGEQND